MTIKPTTAATNRPNPRNIGMLSVIVAKVPVKFWLSIVVFTIVKEMVPIINSKTTLTADCMFTIK